MAKIHRILDWEYGRDGLEVLDALLAAGSDVEERSGPGEETPLHVAARRRRCEAVELLLDHGASIDARTAGGKTAYVHAVRRGFGEVADLLRARGADTSLAPADALAVAVLGGRLEEARSLLEEHPGIARTGNPEEDRLLADASGRNDPRAVSLLLAAGADLGATGLDGGTALHQAAWFGQPGNAALLLEAGAPVDVFDPVHESSPIGWAVHGSRYSGGAAERKEQYLEVVRLLLDAGSSLSYPDESGGNRYVDRLCADAVPAVRELLPCG